jgi:hypothetical protein
MNCLGIPRQLDETIAATFQAEIIACDESFSDDQLVQELLPFQNREERSLNLGIRILFRLCLDSSGLAMPYYGAIL